MSELLPRAAAYKRGTLGCGPVQSVHGTRQSHCLPVSARCVPESLQRVAVKFVQSYPCPVVESEFFQILNLAGNLNAPRAGNLNQLTGHVNDWWRFEYFQRKIGQWMAGLEP